MREPLTFADAHYSCLAMNSTLPSIHSVVDNNYIFHLAFENTVWLGLVQNSTKADNLTHKGEIFEAKPWIWTDGSPVDIKLWTRGGWFSAATGPLGCSSDCCAAFMNTDGMWDHGSCNGSEMQLGYVCQFDAFANETSNSELREMLLQLIDISDIMKREQETTRTLIQSLGDDSERNTNLLKELTKVTDISKKMAISILLLFASFVIVFAAVFVSRLCANVQFRAARFQKLQFRFVNTDEDEDPVHRV